MAYNFTPNSNTANLLISSAVVTAAPLTISCFFYQNTIKNGNSLWIANSGFTSAFGMYPAASGAMRGYILGTGGTADWATSANYSASTWHHSAVVFASTTFRTVFLDGGNSTTNTSNITPTNLTLTRIGWTVASTDRIAEVGIWNAALTTAEIASLAKGMTCDKIRPQNLVFYAPLIRDLQDVKGGRAITNNNSATVATHPRIYP